MSKLTYAQAVALGLIAVDGDEVDLLPREDIDRLAEEAARITDAMTPEQRAAEIEHVKRVAREAWIEAKRHVPSLGGPRRADMIAQPDLPYARRGSAHSRHASYLGAVVAQPLAGSQAHRILRELRGYGPSTYFGLADATGLPLATICARMNWLQRKGLVRSCGLTNGLKGAKRSLWEATR